MAFSKENNGQWSPLDSQKEAVEMKEIKMESFTPLNPFPEEEDEDSDGVEVGTEPDKTFLIKMATALDTTGEEPNEDQKEREGIYTDYEEVLRLVGFGKAQILIMLGVGLVLASDSVEVLGIGYILQYLRLETEFGISSWQVALLSANTFIGMLIGGYIWGGLSDIGGRRTVLIMSLFFNSFFAFISAMSPNYYFLLVTRFLSGVGVGGSLPVFGPYLSEFAGSKYRGSYLNFMSTSWITGAVAVTTVAWALLPQEDIGLTVSGTSVHSWRVFLFLCAVPAFVGGILCILMPEGPRYLIEVRKEKRAIRILRNMYYLNNPLKYFNKIDTFPVKGIKLHLSVQSDSSPSIKYLLCNCHKNFLEILKRTLKLFHKNLIRSTILLMFINFGLSFGSYGVTLWFPSYVDQLTNGGLTTPTNEWCNNTLSSLSLDDNSNEGSSFFCSCPLTSYSNVTIRVSSVDRWWAWQSSATNMTISGGHYKWVWLDTVQWDMVHITDVFIDNLLMKNSTWMNVRLSNVSINNTYICETKFIKVSADNGSTTDDELLNESLCQDLLQLPGPFCPAGEGGVMAPKDYDREYSHDLIITTSGYVGNLLSAIAVFFFIRSYWLAFSLFISTISVFMLYFIKTETGAVVLLSVFKAITIPAWSSTTVLVADLFPTALRSTAVGVFLLLARIGAIIGTYIFGLFTSTSHVTVPVLLTAAILLASAILSLLLPWTTRKTSLK